MQKRSVKFAWGEAIGQYRFVHGDGGLGNKGEDARPLSESGATSIVYLVEKDIDDSVSLRRVAKIFYPTPKVTERNAAAGRTEGVQDFLEEIKLLAKLTHQNLVKIIDVGQVASKFRGGDSVDENFEEKDLYYYIMEHVDGPTLKEVLDESSVHHSAFKEAVSHDPFLICRIAQQICFAIQYMHSEKYFHFDIAPKNIFVRSPASRPHVIVGDLGVSRRIDGDNVQGDERTEKVFISGTKLYCPELLRDKLNTEVEFDILKENAEYWDAFSIACVIEEMIEKTLGSGGGELDATRILCKMIKEKKLVNSSDIYKELRRLLPANVITAEVEELSSDAAGAREYVTIPLYSVPTTARIRKVISHPEFARLQSVPQMFLVRSAFPGGVHSMYEHALGSYCLTLRIVQRLLSTPRFRVEFSAQKLEETLLLVLLSRTASFPFDRVLNEVGGLNKKDILEERLNYKWPDHEKTLRKVLEEEFSSGTVENVLSMINRDRDVLEPYQRLIKSIHKSSIDVRVMDYLTRDSHHTGVPIGAGVDIGSIISGMVWVEQDDSLGVEFKCIPDLENLFCARSWMFGKVYWGPQIRSVTAMMRHVIHKIVVSGLMNEMNLARKLFDHDEIGALRMLKSEWNYAVGEPHKDVPIIDMLGGGRPRAYVLLAEWNDVNCDFMSSAREELKTPSDLEKIGEDYVKNSGVTSINDSDVIFDLPLDESGKFGEDISVEIEPGNYRKAKDVSELINVLPNAFLKSSSKLRAYCNPNIEDQKLKSLSSEVKSFVKSRFSS